MNILNYFTNSNYTNYADLIKPNWAPPAYLFGPVWTFLYIIIIITFGYTFYLYFKKRKGVKFKTVLPFILNIIFNLLFTPIQFGLKNNFLAAIDIILVLLTIIWFMVSVYKKDKRVALWNIPYLLWVSFATILQLTITYLNM